MMFVWDSLILASDSMFYKLTWCALQIVLVIVGEMLLRLFTFTLTDIMR